MNNAVPDGGGGAEYSSIKLTGMSSLISQVTTAASALQSTTQGLQSQASGCGVTSPAFHQITEIGAWAEEQIPGLRRRLALAQSMEKPDGGKMPASVTIDESQLDFLTPAQAKAAAQKDAKDLKSQMDDNGSNGSGLKQSTVDDIKAQMNDPYYAAAFARAYPPSEMAKVLNQLNTQEQGARQYPDPDDPDQRHAIDHVLARQRELLEALGTTAATASRGTGDLAPPTDYSQQFLDAIGAGGANSIPMGGPASVNALLHYGNWSTTFSTQYNQGLITFGSSEKFQEMNQSPPGWFQRLSYGSESTDIPLVVHVPGGSTADWDPMTGGMNLLGKDATASQAILKDKAALQFLEGHDWTTDHGDALGNAIQSATTVYRGQDGAGRMSAQIASNVMATINADDLKDDNNLHDMRDSMGRLIAGYIIDVNRVANGGSDTGAPGVYTPALGHEDNADIPGQEPPGAMFDLDQLKSVMSATETDNGAFRTVMAASTALSKTLVDTATGQAAKDPKVAQRLEQGILPIQVSNAIQNASKLQGMVMATGDAGNIGQAKTNDANRATALSFIRSVVDLAPVPGGDLVNWAVSQGKDALFNKFQTDETSSAINGANNGDDASRTMMQQIAVASLAKNGLLNGTKLSPYAYEKKGSAADFTDKDGNLLPLKELTATGNEQRLTAYKAWLQDNNSPLGAVRSPINSAFDSAYPHWGNE